MQEETCFAFNMAPIRVWTHLADFDAYALWHPSYCFENSTVRQKRIPLHYALFRGECRLNTEAELTVFERAHGIAWTICIDGIAVFEERYSLAPLAMGTQIRHSIVFQGFLGRVMGLSSRRALHQTLVNQDNAFVRFLKKEMRGAASGHRQRKRAVLCADKAAND